jgi:hypothetical protein
MNGSNGTSSIPKNNTYAQDISLPGLGSPPPPILSDPGDPQNFFVYSLVHRNLVFPLKRFTPAVTEAQIPDIANFYLVYGDRCQDYRYSSTHKVSYYIAFKATMRLCIQTYDSSYKIGMNTSVVSEHNDLTWSGERDNCRNPWSQRDHRFSSDNSNNLTTAGSSAARGCTNNCTGWSTSPIHPKSANIAALLLLKMRRDIVSAIMQCKPWGLTSLIIWLPQHGLVHLHLNGGKHTTIIDGGQYL